MNHSQWCFRNNLGLSRPALRAAVSINSNDGRGRPCSRVALRQTLSRHCSQNAPVSIVSNVSRSRPSSPIARRQAAADCFRKVPADNTADPTPTLVVNAKSDDVYLRTASHYSRSVSVFQLSRSECNHCSRSVTMPVMVITEAAACNYGNCHCVQLCQFFSLCRL